ncbi:MAG TPA: hypothetical protein VIY54_10965 [Steroidobacteraceae bacterium]
MLAGFVVFIGAATLLNLLMRSRWRAYASVEAAMNFTNGMMAARLLVGVAATFAAGAVVARVSRGDSRSIWAFGLLMLGLFCAEHYALWHRLPIWYHIVWLGSILPMTLAGAEWGGRRLSPSRQPGDRR